MSRARSHRGGGGGGAAVAATGAAVFLLALGMVLATGYTQDALLDLRGGEDQTTPAVATATTTTKEENPLASWPLARRKFVVVQADTRLRPVLKQEAQESDFASNVPLVSVLAMHAWARSRGYGYVFMDIEDQHCVLPPGPSLHGNTSLPLRLAYYWCKVPAMLLANALLMDQQQQEQHPPTEQFLLFVDTDTFPGGAANTTSLEDILAANPEPWHMLVNSDKGYYWWGVTKDVYLNTGGGINSGVLLLRVSRRTQELIWSLWFELTRHPTPYELHASLVRMTMPASVATEADAESVVRTRTNARVTVKLDRKTRVAAVSLASPAPTTSASLSWTEFDALARALCAPPHPEAAGSAAKCEVSKADTLLSWPGDQDRLNWLADLHAGKDILLERTSVLGGGCLKGKKLVGHWCRDAGTKAQGAREAFEALCASTGLSCSDSSAAYHALRSRLPWLRVSGLDLSALQGDLAPASGSASGSASVLRAFRVVESHQGEGEPP